MPNYGLLTQALLANQSNVQTPDIMGGFLSGLAAVDESKARKANLKMAEKQHELATLQGQRTQAELDNLPEEQRMKKEQHAQNIAQGALGMQATRQGMGTAALNQQQIKQQMEYAQKQQKIGEAKELQEDIAHIHALPAANRPTGYKLLLQRRKQQGLSNAGAPEEWGPEAEEYSKHAYLASGVGIKHLEAQIKQQNLLNAQNPQLKEQKKEFDKDIVEATKTAKLLSETEQTVNDFLDAASKMPGGTGPLTGRFARLSPKGQEAIKNSSNLVMKVAKENFGGRITDADLSLAEKSTLSVLNDPKTNLNLAKPMIYKAKQYAQAPQFLQDLKNQGIYDKSLAAILWNNYVSENKMMDKNGNVRKDIPSYKKYVSPKYINSLLSGEEYKDEQPKGNKQQSSAYSSVDTGQLVVGKDGKQYKKVAGGYVPA